MWIPDKIFCWLYYSAGGQYDESLSGYMKLSFAMFSSLGLIGLFSLVISLFSIRGSGLMLSVDLAIVILMTTITFIYYSKDKIVEACITNKEKYRPTRVKGILYMLFNCILFLAGLYAVLRFKTI